MNYFGPWLGQMSQFLTIEDMVTFNNIQHTNYKMGHVLELWNKMGFALFFFFILIRRTCLLIQRL